MLCCQTGLEFSCLELDVLVLPLDVEAIVAGVLYHALSGYGFLTDTFQTDCETHLDPVERSSVTHS